VRKRFENGSTAASVLRRVREARDEPDVGANVSSALEAPLRSRASRELPLVKAG